MEPEFQERALRIVEDSVDIPETERREFVNGRCGNDEALYREVSSLLQHAVGVSIQEESSGAAPLELPDRSSSAERYELRELLARGGMGVVYRAFDRDLERDVAVKIVAEELRDDARVLDRFVAEGRISAWLQHPGVPPVYDLGRLPDGRPFLAMKLVKGVTLKSLLVDDDRSPQRQTMLLSVFLDVCEALAFAHGHRVVHRDVKPDNVMVGEFGEVHLMDWGIARIVTDEFSGSVESDVGMHDPIKGPAGPRLRTRIGAAAGTPSYMPPEQSIGRSGMPGDVFSLGAILCEILTESPPYTGDTTTGVLEKSARAELQDAQRRLSACGADAELVELARHCLDPGPECRPRDAGEVAGRVREYQNSILERARAAELETERKRVESREAARRRRLASALGISIIGALLIMTGIVIQASRRSKAAARSAMLTVDGIQRNEYWFDNGRVIALREQTVEEAISTLLAAIDIDPSNALAHDHLSELYLRDQRSEEALSTARRAIELDPELYHPRYVVASILQTQGDWIACARAADRGLERDPRPAGMNAALFRFWSARARVRALAEGTPTQGEVADALLSEAIALLRRNLDLSDSPPGQEFSRRALRDTDLLAVSSPERLEALDERQREAWLQLWSELETAVSDN